jgi:hypothetical protein
MAEGLAAATANSALNLLCKGTAWTPPSAGWVQLHTGAPGAAGTSNVASNSTRKQATFGTDAAGGSIANTVAVTWPSVSAAETYTKFSFWTLSSGGTFLLSGTVTANAVAVTDDFTAAIGAMVATLTIAS